MEIGIAVLLLVGGLIGLWKGADWLVDGASDLGLHFNVSQIYIGLTVVAFGTSLPELIVSLFAILSDKPGISIGNIIGSNIANIGLIIGLSALIFPLAVKPMTIAYEFPMMIILSFLVVVLGNKQYIFLREEFYFGRFDGIIFIACFCVFLYYIYRSVKKGKDPTGAVDPEQKTEGPKFSRGKDVWLISLGIILLFAGGRAFVDSSSAIAEFFKVPEVLIGLTIVSIGTSLPELFTSVIAATKKRVDIAVGNIVGSNIFNIAWVLGIVSVIKDIKVDPELLYIDAMVMMIFTLIFHLFAAKSRMIKRSYGAVLLIGYAAYIGTLVISEMNLSLF